MLVHRFRLARLLRALTCPLLIALPPLVWVAEATRRASFTTLGRDQGIFQYVAWALARGVVDYRDVRDVNGPLTHFVHLVFLALGGADEHRFRLLDLAVTGASFALVGACLPGLWVRRPESLERIAWALAGWVVLSGQYLSYKFWDLAQRESFFDWFMLPSVALQLVTQAGRRGADPGRRQLRGLAIAGALSVAPWFGKPTYALFTLVQILALLVDDGMAVPRKKALLAFGLGGAAASALALAFLASYGDPLAYARIQLVDVPAMYRFIWPRTASEILSLPWASAPAILAFAGALGLGALVLSGAMPARAAAICLLPLAALASVIAQAKGFPYHLHPLTAAVSLQWLLFCAWLTERARTAVAQRAFVRLFPMAASAALAVHVATTMQASPHAGADWLLAGPTAQERTTRNYFNQFPEPDFFPFEMRQAAAYLKAHTAASDRVQIYGMDPYLLFLAERLSATPYIYGYDLNADAALAGGSGGRPDERQSAVIRGIRDAHEADLLARVVGRPPAAFVFFDGAPLLSTSDAWDDFEIHCPRSADWVRAGYRESARFGHDRVWLRKDLIAEEGSGGADGDPSIDGRLK
jgi:hypothetical protein